VGGQEVTINGKPIREVVFTLGGVPAKVEPSGGITGNAPMLMMDKNNLEVAALIQKWLASEGPFK
jgi:hypothetical protein